MLHNTLERINNLKREYQKENGSYQKKLLFHVGVEAGLFSELNNMMIAMCYCHVHKIQFLLYADDANFTGGNGWGALFQPFCKEMHSKLNRYGNYRHKNHFRFKRILLPNLIFRKFILPAFVKRIEKVDYLTQDVFPYCISNEFLNSHIKWDLFNIDGKVGKEFVKLKDLVLNYSDTVEKEISKMIYNLNLPERYISVQIRGGDKLAEYEELYDAQFFLDIVKKKKINTESLFVFTDDYRNITHLKESSSFKIYTLVKTNEQGYYNESFNRLHWKVKRKEIEKLMAMIEICLNSQMHYGYAGTCTDDFISNVKPKNSYYSMGTNRCLRNKNMRYYVRKFLKFK